MVVDVGREVSTNMKARDTGMELMGMGMRKSLTTYDVRSTIPRKIPREISVLEIHCAFTALYACLFPAYVERISVQARTIFVVDLEGFQLQASFSHPRLLHTRTLLCP